MFLGLNTMLEDGRNGLPMNIQRRNKETDVWNASWLLPYVHAAYSHGMSKRIKI